MVRVQIVLCLWAWVLSAGVSEAVPVPKAGRVNDHGSGDAVYPSHPLEASESDMGVPMDRALNGLPPNSRLAELLRGLDAEDFRRREQALTDFGTYLKGWSTLPREEVLALLRASRVPSGVGGVIRAGIGPRLTPEEIAKTDNVREAVATIRPELVNAFRIGLHRNLHAQLADTKIYEFTKAMTVNGKELIAAIEEVRVARDAFNDEQNQKALDAKHQQYLRAIQAQLELIAKGLPPGAELKGDVSPIGAVGVGNKRYDMYDGTKLRISYQGREFSLRTPDQRTPTLSLQALYPTGGPQAGEIRSIALQSSSVLGHLGAAVPDREIHLGLAMRFAPAQGARGGWEFNHWVNSPQGDAPATLSPLDPRLTDWIADRVLPPPPRR